MIRFIYPDKENAPELLLLCPENEAGKVARTLILDLLSEEEDGVDIAVCFAYGTFLVRRFYEEYEFTYPLALDEGADVEQALSSIEEYAKRHELPLLYGDLTAEEQGALAKRYRLSRTEEFDISEEDEKPEMIYRLSVLTPCDILEELPTLCDGELTLDAITEEDIPSYALLCRDEEILEVWGVDYRDIDPDMSDRDFFEGIVDEFERGIALTLAVRYSGRLVGEIALYAFDGRGGAEFSIRIFRGYHKNGYGARALALLFAYAKEELMLEHVDGICLCENIPSRRLMEKHMTLVSDDGEMVKYRICL